MKPKYRALAVLLSVMAALAIAGASLAVAQPRPVAPAGEIPFLQRWETSGHADIASEVFNHWNSEGEIPTSCAKCHSTPGFLDFMGMDRTDFRKVDRPAPVGTAIQCIACHNDQARLLTSVVFPSGAEISDLGGSARCVECHQGRTSTVQVNSAIDKTDPASLDTPNPSLSFINVHYFAAGATLLGSEAQGGYQYADMKYQPRFAHVVGYDGCSNCHDPHNLQIKIGECAGCHKGVETTEDLKNVRMNGSLSDYDGDGNIAEGIDFEIQGLQEKLLKSMQLYAAEVAGKPIAYDPNTHPYFFIDLDNNGVVDQGEAVSGNGYDAFTPRLLKASYNYQYSVKDPGAFAHNAKYVIQLLFDSIQDLNQELSQPVDMSSARRDDPGHFDATAETFRHWDAEGEIPSTCVTCHTSNGLPFFLKNGVVIDMEPSNSLACTTCHSDMRTFSLLQSRQVIFPSGAKVQFADSGNSNLCLQCHQGRESTVGVNAAILHAGVGPNQVSAELSFQDPHYLAAGATLFGSEVHGAYEYAGMKYNGRFSHVAGSDVCDECHDAHSLSIKTSQCATCHLAVKTQEDLQAIRFGSPLDYDGDGNTTEGIAAEIMTMQGKLLASIQSYAASTLGSPIAYDSTSYPYWFADTNGNGTVDPDEAEPSNSYARWTPNLLRATYNYQWVVKDPGAFAHNNEYVMQILYDSIKSVGGRGAVAGMTRPPVQAAQ